MNLEEGKEKLHAMMNTKSIYIIILLSFLFSCSQEKETKKEERELKDTIINLSINDKRIELKAKKGIKVNFQDFQAFLNEYSNKPLLFIDTISTDVTGDGKDEKVTRKVVLKDKSVLIFAKIFKENKLIYEDSLVIVDEYAFMSWDNDSIYFKLKPYSAFYEAQFNKEILDSLNKDYPGYEYWIEFYINSKKNEFLSKGIDSLTIINKVDSITEGLKKFEGKLIFTMHQLDRDILIWNNEKNEFEMFYSP